MSLYAFLFMLVRVEKSYIHVSLPAMGKIARETRFFRHDTETILREEKIYSNQL